MKCPDRSVHTVTTNGGVMLNPVYLKENNSTVIVKYVRHSFVMMEFVSV